MGCSTTSWLAGEDAGDVIGDDPMHALAVTSAANLASWRQPGALDGDRTYPWGTFPARAGLVINVGEVALHAWDLAKPTGQSADIDADVAQVIYDFYRRIPMDGCGRAVSTGRRPAFRRRRRSSSGSSAFSAGCRRWTP